MNLEFENRVVSFHGTKKNFLNSFQKTLDVLSASSKFHGLKAHQGTFMLTMVGDKEIQALNKEYRHLNKPTDVLSFSYFGEKKFPGNNTIGEIVISIPRARKQAQDHGKTLNEELQFLFLHGLLHVFGYDHMTRKERQEMFDLQDKIIGNKSWREIADREAEEIY